MTYQLQNNKNTRVWGKYLNTGKKKTCCKRSFLRQSLKRFTFCVKSSDSILFLLGLSLIVNYLTL